MKYQLIQPINPKYKALAQILANRNIPEAEWEHYLNTTDEDINPPELLGGDKLTTAAKLLMLTVQADEPAIVIVDSDCDGYTSSAVFINYMYDLFPSWTINKLKWFIHDGKQHGLNDCVDLIIQGGYKLVILPDSGTNDIEKHQKLEDNDIRVIVLDHHEQEKEKKLSHTIIINNQTSGYPNKFLSGVGVTWQFCRFLDGLMGTNHADEYIDLVALGNSADMMSLTSIETKHLINKGIENIKNPFFDYMADKNSYSLGDKITSFGISFYIAPYVNAMVRSGTQEEKEILFKSMLKFKAFQNIPSNKRGHRPGEEELLVIQAVRTVTNVKNRQTRAQDAGLDFLEHKIIEENLLDNKVLLFLLEPGSIDANIAGLVANKFMSKYQRPVCILTRGRNTKAIKNTIKFEKLKEDEDGMLLMMTIPDKEVEEITETVYQGSARGCDKVGVTHFKDICEQTGVVDWVIGHQGAFGLCIHESNIQEFIDKTNELLKDINDEPIYYVDYIYQNKMISEEDILDIGRHSELWGKDMDEPYIAIEGLKVTGDMLAILGLEKNRPVLRINIPNTNITLIKYNATEDEYNKLYTKSGCITINVIGTCNLNVWNGQTKPQVIIEDYEITEAKKFIF